MAMIEYNRDGLIDLMRLSFRIMESEVERLEKMRLLVMDCVMSADSVFLFRVDMYGSDKTLDITILDAIFRTNK